MKRLLTSKAGVTVLEGIIALGLLALVTGGAFAVLLSASRQTSQPDVQEEMSWAVEKVNKLLRIYPMYLSEDDATRAMRSLVPPDLANGLCGGDLSPMSTGEHDVACMLPPLCDKNNSSFTYTVTQVDHREQVTKYNDWNSIPDYSRYTITYDITCNGYKL